MAGYDFFLLALLFSVPPVVVLLVRPDLRPVARASALASLPFALTERWFVPEYWEPRFLFDLGARIGFGIEDVLFVLALGAFGSTAYAAAFGRVYVASPDTRRLSPWIPVAAALALAALLYLASVPMIDAALLAMVAASFALTGRRRDLVAPALLGGLLNLVVYTSICVGFEALLPGVFARVWHAERHWNRFVFSVPLEELVYGFFAGSTATAFYPTVFGRRLVRRVSARGLGGAPAGRVDR